MATRRAQLHPVTTDEPFGIFLRRVRELYGLSQAELANLCSVQQSAVARWESGAPVNEATVRRVAKALGIHVRLAISKSA